MDKLFDDAKTMAEHQNIIITHYKTGRLDRADAIKNTRISTIHTLSIMQQLI